MRLLWLPDVLRDAGFDLHIEPGWETRGKDTWGPVKAIVAHHTAWPMNSQDYPSLRIVRDGRLPPDPSPVPGPLSQLGLGRSGKVYVIASGRANHAGSGSHSEFNGSSQSIGIEAEHPGGSAPWSAEQYEAYVALCATLANHLDIPTRLVVGHKEWAPARKTDPNFNMDTFRGRIEQRRSGMAHQHNPPPGQVPSWVSPTEWAAWVARSRTNSDTIANDFYRYDWSWIYSRVIKPIEDEMSRFAAEVRELQAEVDALKSSGGGGTVDNLARTEIAKLRNHLRQA